MENTLESQFKFKKDWINPLISIFLAIFTIIIFTLIINTNLEFLRNPLNHFLVFNFIKIHFHLVFFSNIALIFLLTGAIFYLWFGLGTQKCNIGTSGFGFSVSGAIVICLCLLHASMLYYHI